jgi:WD40 repeat protein
MLRRMAPSLAMVLVALGIWAEHRSVIQLLAGVEAQVQRSEITSRSNRPGSTGHSLSAQALDKRSPLFTLNCDFADFFLSASHRDQTKGFPNVDALAFGCKILTVAGRQGVYQCDPSNGKRLAQWGKREGCVKALSPDGNIIAMRVSRDDIYLLETGTGKELCHLSGIHDFYGRSNLFTFSLDSRVIATDYFDPAGYCIRFWDTLAGEERPRLPLSQHIQCMALSPDSKTLAVGHGWGKMEIELYSLTTGRQLRRFGEPRIPHLDELRSVNSEHYRGIAIRTVVFSPDGTAVAAGDNDGNIAIYDAASGKTRVHLRGPVRSVYDLRVPWVGQMIFSPDSRILVALDKFHDATVPHTIRIWETYTGKQICAIGGDQGKINAIALSPDGRTLACGSDSGTISVWNVPALIRGSQKPSSRLEAEELDTCWTNLGGIDALKAHQAIWTLVGAESQSVPFLQERLVTSSREGEISRLIAELDSDCFDLREKAMKELEEFGEIAEPALRERGKASPPFEVQRRIESLLKKLEPPVTSRGKLRAVRSLQVLEQIGTPQAQAILETLSRGTAGSELTGGARAALQRLAKRSGAAEEPPRRELAP